MKLIQATQALLPTQDQGFNVLVSIVKKNTFDPETYRRANVMRTLARRQRKFTL